MYAAVVWHRCRKPGMAGCLPVCPRATPLSCEGSGTVILSGIGRANNLETTILTIGTGDDHGAIARAAAVIRSGGLVAFPTETVYGLGADALSAAAVGRIYEAKRRSPDDPCIVHLADPGDLRRVAALPPGGALAGRVEALAEAFWPGPLSLVLPRGEAVPRVVTAGGDSVAVRVPAHPVALALLRAATVPLAAPSANLFMHTSPTTAGHVLQDLGGRIELILDGGPTAVGVESTVLDLTGEVPTVLRPGGTSLAALRRVLGSVVAPGGDRSATGSQPAHGAAMRAPGTLATHYAPNTEVLLFDGPTEAVRCGTERSVPVPLISSRCPRGCLAPGCGSRGAARRGARGRSRATPSVRSGDFDGNRAAALRRRCASWRIAARR